MNFLIHARGRLAGQATMTGIAVVLLLLVVGWSFMRGLKHSVVPLLSDEVVLRLAHTNLQPGVREAYDELIRLYQERNPGVRIEQMGVPIRIYSSWLQTQLVGGMAPDLIEIRHGQRNEFVARYFVPLTSWVQQVNPYNAGTALEEVRWRDTFLDGLQNDPNFLKGLLEYYSIPGTMRTYRLVANRELYERIAGQGNWPASFEEFLAICRAAEAWRGPRGERITPLAAGGWAGFQLLDRYFRLATQGLHQVIDPYGQGGGAEEDVAAVGLAGAWSLRSPAVQAGLQLMEEVGRHMPAGFWQTPVADVHFQFLQGQALFMVVSSQELASIWGEATFPLMMGPAPDPAHDAAPLDELMVGQVGEGVVPTMASLGLSRQSAHPERAIDFLHFLSSVEGNRIFSQHTGWMPAVDGVEPPERMAAFRPRLGHAPGFSAWLMSPEVHRPLYVNLHHLVERSGSAERFTAAIEGDYTKNLVGALARHSRTQGEVTTRLDGAMAVWLWRSAGEATGAADADGDRKIAMVDEAQVGAEAKQLYLDAAARGLYEPVGVPRGN